MASCQGQTFIPVPESSQRAVVIQRIGLTDITIVYHRPLVGGRKIWGGVVPLGQVWRAGANENTTIEFSDAVTIEGQALAKGIYGLHMIPGPDRWTVIFSKNATSWGSFSYDEKEDALRVTVKPGEIDFHEALAYEFHEVKPGSAQATLKWEKVSVPFVIAVADDVVLEHFRNSLRTGAQYYWEGWDEAASYCMSRKINYEEALQWSDKSIQAEERFENLATKRDLLKALNRADESAAVWNRATEVAGPMQLYFYGRGLQFRNQPAEALDTFRATAKRFPEHWVGHLALARVKSSEGDFSTAAKEVKAAQAAGVPEQQKANVEKLLHRLEAGEDINK
jgi:tetratricopeptide (TPR) repeat protein